MRDANPYQPPEDATRRAGDVLGRSSRWLWASVGFLLGAALPVSFGAWVLYNEAVSYATLPPGTSACRTDTVGAVVMIVVMGPLMGWAGSLVGRIAHNEAEYRGSRERCS